MKLLKWIRKKLGPPPGRGKRPPFISLFSVFQEILELNNRSLDLMADMGNKLSGDYIFDRQYIQASCREMADLISKLVYNLNIIAPKKYQALDDAFRKINDEIKEELAGKLVIPETDHVMPYEIITRDFSDVVGGKNANLAEIINQLGLEGPKGFAVTTRAYRSFLEDNQLVERLDSIAKDWQEGALSEEAASGKIQSLILAGTIPHPVKRAVEDALERLQERIGKKDLRLAVRSSAWGEDSELTFAGQYVTFLNETREDLLDCYKKVLAGAFSRSAMEYRRQKGFSENEVAMAAACQQMIDAEKSGVLYTLDPLSPEREVMIITASWGLGAPVVAGKVRADRYTVLRDPSHGTVSLDIVRKTEALVTLEGGGCEFRPVPEKLQTMSCLTGEQVRAIAETGIMIERYFKKPQDVEWAIDATGRLFVLQARPLNIRPQIAPMVCSISEVAKNYPVVFANQGSIAQNGIATGRVFPVTSDDDLDRFPNGAILVAKQTSPRFARIIRKANGIITDIGSPTGHMATVAREFMVPTIVGAGNATELLEEGREITMDAEENVVYDGFVKELCYHRFTEEAFSETYEYRLLRRVLKRISPLSLLDPFDKNFAPSACRSFHDITRFIHEKAVEELIDLNYHLHHDPKAPGRRLKSNIPLDLIIMDIGGGFDEAGNSRQVREDQIFSIPMRAFLAGLSTPGIWSSEPMSVDFGSFMSSLTKTFSSNLANPKYVGQNLAVISKEYANISLRLGYHFNMIDAYIGANINDNYAYFRFLGGVTDQSRRSRRARFISEILGRNDFRVDLRADLVVARVKKLDIEAMEQKVNLIGQLVAFTRQLDVQMNNDNQVMRFVREFDHLTKMDGIHVG